MVLTLDVPLICPLAAEGTKSEEKFYVRVLKKHPQQLWVTEEHIPWILQYMATEYALGGVPENPADPAAAEEESGEEAEPDSAVAESNIKWDWATNDGYLLLVNGKQVRCQISNFTQAKSDKVSKIHKYDTTFEHASREELGRACYDYLDQFIASG